MADLKTLCIDGECRDIPEAGQPYTAGTNIEIAADNVINSLIQSGNNISVGSDGKVSLVSSPALSGTPTTPTAGATSNNTTVASTAFTQDAINRRLPKSIVATTIDNFNLASGSEASKTIWTATGAGTLIVVVSGQFAANTAGYRRVRIFNGSRGTGTFQAVGASQSGATAVSAVSIIRVASGNVISARFYQNSGATLAMTACYGSGYFIPD